MSYTRNGMLFFIKPHDMPRVKDSTASKDMEFDVTYLTDCDTVYYTVSVFTATPLAVDSVSIHSGEGRIVRELETIYVEPSKSRWENRLRFYVLYDEFEKLYALPQSFRVSFGHHPNQASFCFGDGKWKKECEMMNFIINVINQNKK